MELDPARPVQFFGNLRGAGTRRSSRHTLYTIIYKLSEGHPDEHLIGPRHRGTENVDGPGEFTGLYRMNERWNETKSEQTGRREREKEVDAPAGIEGGDVGARETGRERRTVCGGQAPDY